MKRSSRKKVVSFIKNPLTIVLPLIALLWFGWMHYVAESRDLSVAQHNLFAAGNFDTFDSHHTPVGWHIDQARPSDYVSEQVKGYVSGSAWKFTVQKYTQGSVLLYSDKVAVQPNQTYLFKGYYSASTTFDLLIKYYFSDGSSRWEYVQTYPAESGQWSTASEAFNTDKTITAVAFGYQLSGQGSLALDGVYLEAKDQALYLPPAPAPGVALSTAKPLNVHANQRFTYTFDYKGDIPGDVVVEYVLTNGSRKFITVTTLAPSSELVRRHIDFETIPNAQTMLVHVSPHGQRTLEAKNLKLVENTKPGAPTFKRPLVSITFDDGWKSAYDNGAQLMQQLHFKGTFYLNSSVINTKAFMSTWQVQTLHNTGNELGAHGVSHVDMTAVNDNQIRFQLEGSAHYIKQTLHAGAIDFALPYGKSDAEVESYARQYFRSMRGTETGINTRQNFNPYNLRVLYVGSKTTSDEIHRAIEDAKQNNGWLILTYHRIEYATADTADSNVVISPLIFRQHMNLLRQSGLSVVTVQQALDEVSSQ